MNLSSKRKGIISLILILSISFFVYVYLYFLIPLIEDKLEKKIVYISTSNVISAIINTIKNNMPQGDFIEEITNNNDYRRKFTDAIKVFVSSRLKYIFVIYKDNDKYRYLIDIDKGKDTFDVRGLLFIPFKEEIPVLNRVYLKGKISYKIHREIDTVGITYYIPIIQSGEVKAVLVADFSFEILKEILSLMSLIEKSIIAAGSIIFLLLVLSIYYFYKNILLRQKVYVDSLTGLYNRNYLEDIKDVIDMNRYVVVMLDIDFFKNINDMYGHHTGDQILKGVANLIKENLRSNDIVIRYGGEEFLILIERNPIDKDGKWVLQVAQRLLQEIRKFKYKNINITASIGINLDTDKARNFIEAIKKADIVLYKAKRLGRNRIEIYKEAKGKDEDISLVEIKDIIEKGDVICFYQPVFNLKERKVLYYEALARIKFREKYLSPAQFLDIIKGTFLYFKFTKLVIEYNLSILEKYPELYISINLSPSDLSNQTIIRLLTSVKKEIVKRLKLEILESEEVSNYSVLKSNINILKNYGYDIVLDDFGAGYIDFYYLTEIDAKYIKIDGFVIRKIPDSTVYRDFVKHLVRFCKDIGKVPVAEYIENERIYKFLIGIGVEYGQGYYCSKPMPLENILTNS